MKTLLKSGRVIDPKNKRDEVADLFISEGKICGIGNTPNGFKADKILSAKGKIVCPGFIEIGCDLEDSLRSNLSFEQELESASSGGFTTVCLLPHPTYNLEKFEIIEQINKKAKGAKAKCLGALTLGLEGEVLSEMETLKRAGCIGLSNNRRPIANTSVLRNALAYASSLDLLTTLDSHDAWLEKGSVMRSGSPSILAGLPGIPNSSELIGLSRNLILVRETGAKAHMRNLSVSESAELLDQYSDDRITSDVGLCYLLLSDDNIDPCNPNFKVMPPLPNSEDKDILLKQLSDGKIDILSSQHQPVTADLKRGTFESSKPGISCFDTFLPLMLRLVETKKIGLMRLIEAVTTAPAKAIGFDGGDLSINAAANICVFDPNLIWKADITSIRSSGKNSPFLGENFTGKVTQTFIDGKIVYEYQ